MGGGGGGSSGGTGPCCCVAARVPSSDKLIAMRIHGVDEKFIKEVEAMGFSNLSVDKLLTMRIHRIDGDLSSAQQERRAPPNGKIGDNWLFGSQPVTNPAGGLYSTIDDMLLYLQALMGLGHSSRFASVWRPYPVSTSAPRAPALVARFMSLALSPTTYERLRSISCSRAAWWSMPGPGLRHWHARRYSASPMRGCCRWTSPPTS